MARKYSARNALFMPPCSYVGCAYQHCLALKTLPSDLKFKFQVMRKWSDDVNKKKKTQKRPRATRPVYRRFINYALHLSECDVLFAGCRLKSNFNIKRLIISRARSLHINLSGPRFPSRHWILKTFFPVIKFHELVDSSSELHCRFPDTLCMVIAVDVSRTCQNGGKCGRYFR